MFVRVPGAIVIAVHAGAAAPRAQSYTPPRTPEGSPDLRGIWQASTPRRGTSRITTRRSASRPGAASSRGTSPVSALGAEEEAENFAGRATLDPE